MYLKRIVAHGFKSFADKINIEFDNGISGIVGPNGSGKSNVVDAVRWVLGEQSVKSLRGDGTMTDVIFSGSNSRKSANMASITLVFDNTDLHLPVSYTEVSIKRQVYKDGTQEYYLNGEKCRLKDITSILLDTGIAKESFNIISQGKIEEIINSKPNDRRVIFEEAAGVLKYKRRKEDAIRKLERTHENMARVEDIILELKEQVDPLRKQKEQALLYTDATAELKKIEIALISKDITDINTTYKAEKEKIKTLNEEILNLTSSNNTNEATIIKYKANVNKLQIELNEISKKLLVKTSEVEKINSQKQIILERKKYEVEDTKLHSNLISLKEEQLQLNNDIEIGKREISSINLELASYGEDEKLINSELINAKGKKQLLETELNNHLRMDMMLKNKIEALRISIDNNNTLPFASKKVLSNPKLIGIHDAIGNLIEVDSKYTKAISVSLGGAASYIVVSIEDNAHEAIKYLKEQNLGRATFFPINVIKGRYLDETIYNNIKNVPGFIDVASNLVKCNPIYHNIINNQLGNVIVADNLDTATIISKMINGRSKIVTLEGDLVNIGGSLTGGSLKNIRTVIQDKYDLEYTIANEKENTDVIKELENKINENDDMLKNIEDKIYVLSKEYTLKNEVSKSKNILLQNMINKKEAITLEVNGTNHILNNSLSTEEETILKLYYEAINENNSLKQAYEDKEKEKNKVSESLEEYEFGLRRENSLVNTKNKELKVLEIEVNRKDVKLDNLLNTLNETYNITYERSLDEYVLDMDIDIARNKVNSLKHQIKELGVVNLGAIEEYDRISVRYDFLIKQRDDLTQAEDTLLEIIHEMDEVMEVNFKKTFDIISENFTSTFKELFHGGTGELKLTDPTNILETGIEIIASPPGKKLTNISLLSGGEKTFTAISLLFAILKSRPVPFCILDEVEAALDEVNVNSFGNYLRKMKDKTQFIIITHKKRTMEFVDVLYGITMQESGVSKLVSVKLEDLD